MANKSPVYSNARVRVMENTFLNQEKFNRLVYSEDLSEAVKVLAESNYGGGVLADGGDYEKILKAEDDRVNSFVFESMPADSGIECFLIKQDYHNAKSLTKAKYMRSDDYDFMLAPQGLINTGTLKDSIFSDNYNQLPEIMSRALTAIDYARANGDKKPRTIDIILDKACYEHMLKIAKDSKQKSIIKYCKACIDFANVTTFVRARREQEEIKEFKKMFIDGGEISLSLFESVYEQSNENAGEKLRYTVYGKLVADVFSGDDNAMVNFERMADNYLLDIFKQGRTDIFSINPLAGFYVAKKQEIRVVRMILICIKNGIDTAQIKMRLREYYA